jgi:prepilin-type processing-associated H-X9-DG protein
LQAQGIYLDRAVGRSGHHRDTLSDSVPVFGRVREKARSASCQSNLKQLGMGISMYTQDWERYPRGLDAGDKSMPEIWADNSEAASVNFNETPMLHEVLSPYIKGPQVWGCPSDTGYDYDDIINRTMNPPVRPSSFAMYGLSYAYRTELTFLNLNEESLPRPAETNVLCDSHGGWHGGSLNPFDRQTKRYNMLFADNHVKNVDINAFHLAWSTRTR